MKKMLVTGGTVFVSRRAAEYFAIKEWDVYVLNRNTRPQPQGATLIEADRKQLGDQLRDMYFDAVLDITAYSADDVNLLLDGLGGFGEYILISSSAVYPESTPQPFCEDSPVGENSVWGSYGTNKIAAEEALRQAVPQAYILRPPYLYGPMQNVYREPFVFECAEAGRPFCIPGEGKLGLQFFHVADLCRFMEILLETHPENRIFNVGNPESVTVSQWVQLCYDAVGAKLETFRVEGHPQRSFFPFHDYDYLLDVRKQMALMPEVKPLAEGLKESWEWFREYRDAVVRKPLLTYIDQNLTHREAEEF